MSYISQLSLIFVVFILFHILNIYYYFQYNKYFNNLSGVYEYCEDLFRENELIWQNVQVCNIVISAVIAVAFDYFNCPPDFLLNVNNWICFIIIILECRNIYFIDDFLRKRNKI